MEGVLSDDQKKTLMTNLVDAVVKVYGAPMRLFMHVVLEEIKTGDWIAGGGVVTSERVNVISPNVRRTAKAGGRSAPEAPSARPAGSRRPARSRGPALRKM